MKRKGLVKKIKVPLYDRMLEILVTDDIKNALDYYGEESHESDVIESTVIDGEQGLIVLIIKPDADTNTLCHEAFHVTCTIMDDAGMVLCRKSEEAYAYLIGWVGDEIGKAILKANK